MEELSKKELKQAIKNHPRMKEYKKTMRIMMLIFLIGGAVGIFVLPPLGIICIVLLVLDLVIYLIGLIISTAIFKSQIKKKGIEGAYAMYKKVPVAKNQNQTAESSRRAADHFNEPQGAVNDKVSEVLDNPVVGVAASYALGKAVSKPIKLKSQAYTCDPYHGGKNCATCEYWTGTRTVEKRTAGARNKVAICDNKSVHGSCKKPGGRYSNRYRYCVDCCTDGWTVWTALK